MHDSQSGAFAPADVARVRDLDRIFRLYQKIETLAREWDMDALAEARLVLVLRQITQLFWRGFFGPKFDGAEHRRALLTWTERNLAALVRKHVLPLAAYQQASWQIERELADLGAGKLSTTIWEDTGEERHDALVRMYVLQSLNIRLERMVRAGVIAADLREQIRADLVERAERLFSRVLGKDRESDQEVLAALPRMLEEERDRGMMSAEACTDMMGVIAQVAKVSQREERIPLLHGDAARTAAAAPGRVGTSGTGTSGTGPTSTSGIASVPASSGGSASAAASSGASASAAASSGESASVKGARSAGTGGSRPEPAAAGIDGALLLVELSRRLRGAGDLGPGELPRWTVAVERESERLLASCPPEALDAAVAGFGRARALGGPWVDAVRPEATAAAPAGAESRPPEDEWASGIAARVRRAGQR